MIEIELFNGFTEAQVNHQVNTPLIRSSINDFLSVGLSGTKIFANAEINNSFLSGYYVEWQGNFAYSGVSLTGTIDTAILWGPGDVMQYRITGLNAPVWDYYQATLLSHPSNPKVINYLKSLGYEPGGGTTPIVPVSDVPTEFDDDLDGTDGSDVVRLLGGDDKWTDKIDSETDTDKVFGGPGDDKIYFSGGKNVAKGGAGDDYVTGFVSDTGIEKFFGGGGNDRFFGYGGNDKAWGGRGIDSLYGFHGNDKLFGDAGNDWIYGDWINDDYAPGKDKITGGNGDDRLYGGGLADKFIFDRKDGSDIIKDFEDGIDKLVMDGKPKHDFSSLTITANGAHAVVQFGKTIITLENTDVSALTSEDFNFV